MGIAVHQMLYAYLISATETIAIGLAIMMAYRRMTEFIAVLHAGLTVILVIFSSAFDAVVEALRLDSLKLCRSGCPWLMPISWRRWRGCRILRLCCGDAE